MFGRSASRPVIRPDWQAGKEQDAKGTHHIFHGHDRISDFLYYQPSDLAETRK
jgi:hypothetical protein